MSGKDGASSDSSATFRRLVKAIEAADDPLVLDELAALQHEGNGALAKVLSEQDEVGDTLLHMAVRTGYRPLVQKLLALKPPQELTNDKGETPLALLMLLGGPEELANEMIDLGAPLNSRVGLKHSTLVHEAVLHHMDSTLELLLRHHKPELAAGDPRHVPLNARNDDALTPLATAIKTGNGSAALMLAKHPAVDLGVKDDKGDRAIDLAGLGGNAMIDVLLAMMDRGQRADEIPSGKQHSPLGGIVSMCKPEAVKRILHHPQKPRLDIPCTGSGRPLETAIDMHREDMALLLLEEGAPDRIPNEDGSMPLHGAAEKNMVKLAGELVKRGVPQQMKDIRRNLPLHYAFYNGSKEMIALLDKSPKLMDTINRRFATPYEESVFAPRIRDMVNQFIERVVLPAFVIEAVPRPELLQDKAWMDQVRNGWERCVETIKPRVFSVLCGKPDPAQGDAGVMQALTRAHQLSDTWHHPNINFPADALLPLKKDREWHPLFTGHHHMKDGVCVASASGGTAPEAYANQFVSSQGYILTPLTKTDDLRAESDALNHCVGKSNYGEKCCDSQSHIISIRKRVNTPEGPKTVPVATSEIEVIKGNQLRRGQTKTTDDRTASQDMRAAVDEMLVALVQKTLPRNAHQGSTDDDKKLFEGVSDLAIRIGFHPNADWHDVESCFSEYKRNLRRASQGTFKQDGEDRLLYTDQKLEKGVAIADRTFDHYTHPVHFIDGHYSNGGASMSYRDMDVQSWLRATGLMDLIRGQIEYHRTDCGLDVRQLDALKQRWAAEDAVHPIAGNSPPPKTDRERDADAQSWDASTRVGTVHHYSLVDARAAGMGKDRD